MWERKKLSVQEKQVEIEIGGPKISTHSNELEMKNSEDLGGILVHVKYEKEILMGKNWKLLLRVENKSEICVKTVSLSFRFECFMKQGVEESTCVEMMEICEPFAFEVEAGSYKSDDLSFDVPFYDSFSLKSFLIRINCKLMINLFSDSRKPINQIYFPVLLFKNVNEGDSSLKEEKREKKQNSHKIGNIIEWQSDQSAPSCTICNKKFTATRRRHHCMICCKLVCGNCSLKVKVEIFNEKTLVCSFCRENKSSFYENNQKELK